jgi:KaiC/GvpD/RAD55 family RecA-like ATPase
LASIVNRTNNSFLDIPTELGEFVRNDTYSLLIKGRSGTGKTTLSLSILRSLKARNNFFYISTRSSPKQLFEHYPWLRKFTKQLNKDIENEEIGQNISSFEDARLDEPESLFERVTNQLMDVKNPVIIIDSWDSVASLMDREARLNNERVLQTWRERAKAKLIFTSEESTESSLESIVDGVVELNYEFIDDIRIRNLFLKKLRGVPVKRSIYYFTLKGRYLRCFGSYDPREFRCINMKDKIPNVVNSPKHILQTGYQDLDNHIGGTLPRNGLIIIEKDSILSNDIILLFANDLLNNFFRRHYSLLLDDTMKNEITKKYRLNIQNNGKLYTIEKHASNEKYPQNGIKQKGSYYKYLSKLISGFPENEKLITLIQTRSLDNIISTPSDIEELCGFIRKKFELSILILNSNVNLEKYYAESDICLRFILKGGTLFLKCSIPSAALFGTYIASTVPQIQLNHVL